MLDFRTYGYLPLGIWVCVGLPEFGAFGRRDVLDFRTCWALGLWTFSFSDLAASELSDSWFREKPFGDSEQVK